MTAECANLHAYADGELEAEKLPSFELHLLDCADCQRGFGEVMQLATLAEETAARAPAARPLARVIRLPGLRSLPRQPRALMGLAASLAVAVVAGSALWRMQDVADRELWLSDAPSRALEARVSEPEADRYRPYGVSRAGVPLAPPPPLSALAALERKGDQRGIAVAYLIRGSREAERYLQHSGSSPEDELDRSAAALLKNDAVEALERADRSLHAAPGRPQALWNRALALNRLGLSRRAAQDFEQVLQMGEPGWSAEAQRYRDGALAGVNARQRAWDELTQACRRLITEGTPLPARQIEDIRGWSRACFYDGVRAAPTAERALEFLPMAATLDQLYGDAAATEFVRRAAARDFTRRGPLARTYAALATGALPSSEIGAFLERLRAAQETDQLLGALLFAPDLAQHLDEYRRLAAGTGDVWFQLLAEEKQAFVEVSRGQHSSAEGRIRKALEQCGAGSRQNYRCAWLERTLGVAYFKSHQLGLAREYTQKALNRALEGGELFLERKALVDLGTIAQMEGQMALTEAYLEEALAHRTGACNPDDEPIHTSLALVYQRNLKFQDARRHLDGLARCPRPASLNRAFAVADISRVLPDPGDGRVIREGLEAVRSSSEIGPGKLALAKHVEGRFQIERDRQLGQWLLRQAIEAASRQPESDVEAQKARAYSYTSLLLDAGKHGEHARALELFTEELGLPAPSTCALGVTVDDERTLALVRGPKGELRARYSADRKAPLKSVVGLVPAELISALKDCPRVEVIARPPLSGQADLLPVDLPWSYRLSRGDSRAPAMATRKLLVTGAVPPASLQLPPLGPAAPASNGDPSIAVLQGGLATPGRVLEAMQGATEIQLHAHGLVDPQTGASFLALSQDANGKYALGADEVRSARLEGRPVVVLGACYAGRTKGYLHESLGLPAAFIHAGARMVLAATKEVRDEDASRFFESVLQRIRNGQPGAAALRDARMKWVAAGGDHWVDHVLMFE